MIKRVLTTFTLLLFMGGCLQYDKETIVLTLYPKTGTGKMEVSFHNITSDQENAEQKKKEMAGLRNDHKKRKFRNEWKKLGFHAVNSKLTQKDGQYNGKIWGKFRSLTTLAWDGKILKELSINDTSFQLQFEDVDALSEIIVKSNRPIVKSNAVSFSGDKKQHTWRFKPKQQRLLTLKFQD